MRTYVRAVSEARYNETTKRGIELIDELSAAAISMSSGPQAYQNFMHARDEFRQIFTDAVNEYRVLETK